MDENQGMLAWVLGSAGLMILGSFAPWVKVLGTGVAGTDGHNDGWLVVGVALLGALLLLARRRHRSAGIWATLAGVAGAAITLYDRSNVTSAISDAGAFAAVAQVGWGLNLALIAAVSLAVSGLVWIGRMRATEDEAETPPPPTVPTAPPAGWYRDPENPTLLRYWSGSAWTTHTATPASPLGA